MKHKSILGLLLSIMMVLMLCMSVYAASSTTATIPVTLTVSNEYRAVNVTVPASLPVYIINGTVVTADNAIIRNNSKSSAIQVTSVLVTDSEYKVRDYENFSGRSSIALKINGCSTKSAGKLPITNSAFPVIAANGSLALTYFAKVSNDTPNIDNVQAANVVFTISIAD